MQLSEQQVTELAKQYLAGTASEEDKQRLHEWFDTVNAGDTEMVVAEAGQTSEAFGKEMFAELKKMIAANELSKPTVHRVHFLKTSWFKYAAAILLIVSGAAFWYIQSAKSNKSGESVVQTKAADIQPGTNRAILTVGNKSINLSNNKTGIAVSKVITYNDGEKIADAGQQLQLTTPRGGQYQAVLPDGTKVWLNAASSIQFPSKFEGSERVIEVTGEAYLEVAKNTKRPFIVNTGKTTIQVLGTSFNVNAYEDEITLKTTLIDGSVRVVSGESSVASKQEVVLKPGQQVEFTRNSQLITHAADIEQTLAWKNGILSFNNADLETVLRQLSRWYDVEIVYEPGVNKKETFEGKIQRSLNLSDVLYILEKSQVHFRLDGRKLIVMP